MLFEKRICSQADTLHHALCNAHTPLRAPSPQCTLAFAPDQQKHTRQPTRPSNHSSALTEARGQQAHPTAARAPNVSTSRMQTCTGAHAQLSCAQCKPKKQPAAAQARAIRAPHPWPNYLCLRTRKPAQLPHVGRTHTPGCCSVSSGCCVEGPHHVVAHLVFYGEGGEGGEVHVAIWQLTVRHLTGGGQQYTYMGVSSATEPSVAR